VRMNTFWQGTFTQVVSRSRFLTYVFAVQVLVGGKRADLAFPLTNGTFFEPTVLANASIDM